MDALSPSEAAPRGAEGDARNDWHKREFSTARNFLAARLIDVAVVFALFAKDASSLLFHLFDRIGFVFSGIGASFGQVRKGEQGIDLFRLDFLRRIDPGLDTFVRIQRFAGFVR